MLHDLFTQWPSKWPSSIKMPCHFPLLTYFVHIKLKTYNCLPSHRLRFNVNYGWSLREYGCSTERGEGSLRQNKEFSNRNRNCRKAFLEHWQTFFSHATTIAMHFKKKKKEKQGCVLSTHFGVLFHLPVRFLNDNSIGVNI